MRIKLNIYKKNAYWAKVLFPFFSADKMLKMYSKNIQNELHVF